MFSPFIAFIVLFCRSIESSNSDDLQWLESFKISLDPWRSVSQAVDGLARLTQLLYDVASQYVELKRTQSLSRAESTEQGQAWVARGLPDEVDTYLNRLGLLGSGLHEAGLGNNMTASPTSAMGPMDSETGNWYNGVTNMVSSFEHDPLG